jgi:N6-L-threonylcarbamoyladenine synthase
MNNILGIETSCDETAAAIVTDGCFVRSNVVATSLKDHKKYGGIIPEIASRRQLELIPLVVAGALEKAGRSLAEIDTIAVTRKPGLIGSLLVGISFARALSFAVGKPLVEVDHIKAHIYANFLRLAKDGDGNHPSLPGLPAVGLVVSGGHSSLYHVRDFDDFHLIGQTRDDAVGEAFDKVARILNLGYPGGPVIDRLAKEGENKQVRFPRAHLPGNLDFSFSGVKTSVLYHVQKHAAEKTFNVAHVAYAFQQSVVTAIIEKCLLACDKYRARTLLIGGGVAANSALREGMVKAGQERGIKVFFPPMSLCLDNAAMIAGLAFHLRK